MKKIRKVLLWYYLLNKRLFKKISFLIILASVPLLVAALNTAAEEDSGILRIALAQEDPADPAAAAVVEKLLEDDGIIHYADHGEPEKARDAVVGGKADAAWIFSADMQGNIDGFVSPEKGGETVVTVLAREESVFLQLAREKLFAALYSDMSYAIYKDFIIMEVHGGGYADEDEMLKNYSIAAVDREIVQFAFMDEKTSAENGENVNYLTAPVRGFLALMVMLCGLAAAMYLMQDEERGTYTWLPAKRRFTFSCGWHLIAVTDMAGIVLAALALSGMFTRWEREIPLMLLYCLASAGFCFTVKMLCGKMERLGVAIPILMLLMLVLSPVFLNVRKLRVIQYLLPPFYYLHAVNNSDFMKLLCLYTVGIYLVGFVIYKNKA